MFDCYDFNAIVNHHDMLVIWRTAEPCVIAPK